jgi:hypothetical protein
MDAPRNIFNRPEHPLFVAAHDVRAMKKRGGV